jgi:SAF domain
MQVTFEGGGVVAQSNTTQSSRGFWLLLPLVAVLAFFLTVWIAAPLRDGAEPTAVLGAIVDYAFGRVPDFLGGQPPEAATPTQEVLVASVDLRPPLTLSKENIRWQPWPDNALNPVFITRSSRPDAADTLVGSMVRHPMKLGEPIREANLVRRRGDFPAAATVVPAGPADIASKPAAGVFSEGQLGEFKLPTRTSADVTTVMQKLGTKNRDFVERYIAAPTDKVLAREKGGKYMVESHGWHSLEEARQAALETCERIRPVCEFIMENDYWLASKI